MSILKTYDNICRYEIQEPIQTLNVECDINAIKKEALDLIIKHKYSYANVILNLPEGQNDWTHKYEHVEYHGVNACGEDYSRIKYGGSDIRSFTNGTEYTNWHPDANHIRDLKTQLEEYSGLQITKVRLIWMQPDYAYPMHCDYEPIRFHVPILTNSYCFFIHGKNQIYTMPYGNIYHIITDDVHTAMNYGLYPRLHLVYSTWSSDELTKKLRVAVHDKIKKLNTHYTDHKDLDYLIQMSYDRNQEKTAKLYEGHKKINTDNEKDGN